MIRSLLLSNAAFAVKSLFALAITAYLANALPQTDFAIWSVLSSLGLYFTLSDFGLGQYLLRRFVELKLHGTDQQRQELLASAQVIFAVVVMAFFVFSFVVARLDHRLSSLSGSVMSWFLILVLSRTFFLPYAAALSAHELFHIRKWIEAGTYIALFVFIVFSVYLGGRVSAVAVTYGTLFLVCSSAFAIAGKFLLTSHNYSFRLCAANVSVVWSAVRGSIWYFLNNLALLVSRGGMLLVASPMLSDSDVSQFSVFYMLFYQFVFQIFDIAIRTVQPKFIRELKGERLWTYYQYVTVAILLEGATAIFIGLPLLRFAFPKVEFREFAFMAFLFVSVIELGLSMIWGRWAMFGKGGRLLALTSSIRSSLFLMVEGVLYVMYGHITLERLMVPLIIINGCILCFCIGLEVAANRKGRQWIS